MQYLNLLERHFKKGLLLPMFAMALVTAYSQDGDRNGRPDNNVEVALQAHQVTGKLAKGILTDAATKKPLRAIRVTYQNYSAAITDSMGRFTIKVPNYNVALTVEGEGYQRKEIALKGRSTVAAALYDENFTSFYNLAQLPFGGNSVTQSPYALTTVAGNTWNRTAETPDAFLQGKVAGMNVIRRSGTPNIGANLFLRGFSSLYASNQPLVVIDGVVYDAVDYGGSLISNNYTNPLAYIDVKDIDNMTVVKDGSSMYGTKGANGVLLITTSRAKELATRIDFGLYGGVNFAPKKLPLLNAQEYRIYLSDLLQSGGTTESQLKTYPFMTDDINNPQYYKYHNQTEWQDQVFNNSALKNYYLKVTGGDNIAKYALSLGYLTNSGVTRETDLSRYNTRFNADLNLSRRMTATTNLSFTFNEQKLRDQGLALGTNPIYTALVKSPLISVNEISAKGVASPDITDVDTFNVSNPVALINNAQGLNKNYRFLGSIGFNYALSKSVSINNLTAVTVDKVRESMFIPRKGVINDTLVDGTVIDSRLGSQTKRIMSLFNDLRLSYDKHFSQVHHLTSNAGIRFQDSKIEQDLVLGANSATDQLTSVGNGIAALRRTNGDNAKTRWLNTYVNTDYSFSDKYFLSLNVAFDGSSRFGKNVQSGALHLSENSFAVMPSVAAAWLISSERFMAHSKVFDLLKLRASFGLTGNDDIGNFNARQYYISQNFLGTQGLVRGNLGNDQLQWEQVRKLNVGLDVSLFNERVSLAFDAYRNNTTKMLAYEQAPTASGFNSMLTNSGAMKTDGVEAAMNARIINNSAFKWDLGMTIGHYASVVTKLPVNRMTEFAGGSILTAVGEAPNVFYGYKTNGVYATNAEAASSKTYIRTPTGQLVAFNGGDSKFMNMANGATDTLNGGNVTVIDASDRQIIGNPNPDFFGSFNTKLEWKRFSLEALFTFTSGNDIYNYTRRQLESGSSTTNQTTALINRWKNDGQVTNTPRVSMGDPLGNSRFSDRWIEDGSYLRLRTASLSYQLPIKAGFLRYSVLYVTGNNLFTLSKYLGYDPEVSATTNVIGQGIDITLEPQHTSVQVGARFGL